MLRFSSLGQTVEKSMLKEEGFMLLMVSGVISHQGHRLRLDGGIVSRW